MSATDPVLTIVGAGPRAGGLLERIAANAALLAGRPLTIHVVDPYPAGPGKVWRQDQSPLLLMNSRAGEVTMFTDSSVSCAGPIRPGPTLHEWGRTAAAAGLPDSDLAAEAGTLASDSFASRRLAGQYLAWFFREAAGGLPDHVRLHTHAAKAVGLGDGHRQSVILSDGTRLHADFVVLAQGGIGGHTDAEQQAHAEFARRTGGVYLPPSFPGEEGLNLLPAGEPVIVIGLGLAFADIMVMVTEGRGGRFERDRHGRLRYRACGREPLLHVGSRRGVPYLPKPGQQLLGPQPDGPRFFTAGHVLRTLETSATPQTDLLACACREMGWAYYHELFTGHPDLTTCSWPEFAAQYAALPVTSPALDALVGRTVPDAADHLDLGFLRSPLAGLRFTGQQPLNQWMCRRIDGTVRRATRARHSANAALLLGLVTVAGQVDRLFSTGDVARRTGLERLAGRLAGFTGFLGSGPPPHRLEQLAALAEAGVVNFLGANLTVGRDQLHDRFAGRSDTLAGPVFARHLVTARLPDPDVSSGTDALLAGLGGTGRRLPVDPATFQVLDGNGHAHPRRLAMGAFSTGGALGSFARPCQDAAFFRQNDAAARWILGEMGRDQTQVMQQEVCT